MKRRKKLKKEVKITLLVLILLCTVIIPVTFSKYRQNLKNKIVAESTPFYFNTTASDLTILYEDTSSFSFDVLNYNGKLITERDTKYTISWENSVYKIVLNDESYNETDSYTSTLTGNTSSIDHIKISFIAPSDVPVKEKMDLKICASRPYSKCEEYTITIISPDGFDIEGNPTEWTKDDVTLDVIPKEGNNQIEYCSFDDGTTWENANVVNKITSVCSKTFSENQLVKVKTKYFDGTISDTVDVEITKIDKEAPVLNFDYIDTDKKDQTLIATLGETSNLIKNMSYEDDKSGMKDLYVLYDGNVVTDTSIFTKVGRYKIIYRATDNLDNVKDYEREVLVRWDVGGRYIVQRQNVEVSDGNKDNCMGVKGIGVANNADLMGLWQDTTDTGLDTSLLFSSKYYFSGKTVCNNIKFAGKTFNVMNIAVNDSIKVIGAVSSKDISWGSRKIYNSDVYSDWQAWATNKQIYYSDDAQATQLTEAEFSHLIQGTFYPGRFVRNSDQTFSELIGKERYANGHLGGNNDSSFNGYFAFPNVSDYLRASNRLDLIYNIRQIQTNQSTYEKTSWLSQSDEQWTINSKNDTSTDNDYWVLLSGNEIVSRTYYYAQNYRPVFYLSDDTILSGTGTSDDPFVVEENWDWFDSQYPTSLYK